MCKVARSASTNTSPKTTQGVPFLLRVSHIKGLQSIAATLENPPGSESQTEGSMWALPETADFMERFDCAKAWFNTCAYQQKERVRWWKPAQFGGRLNAG